MLWAREDGKIWVKRGDETRDELRLEERSKERSEQKAGRAGVAGAGSGWRPAGPRLTSLHVMDPLNKVFFFSSNSHQSWSLNILQCKSSFMSMRTSKRSMIIVCLVDRDVLHLSTFDLDSNTCHFQAPFPALRVASTTGGGRVFSWYCVRRVSSASFWYALNCRPALRLSSK